MNLENLKKQYDRHAKKYKLPEFNELNENFEIDKVEKDSEFLLRMLRKVMMEKIVNSLSFLEMLLNPVNTPRLYAMYARSMSVEDRKEIERIYGALGQLSINSLDLEIDYSEEKEAEAIKLIFQTWNSIKPDFRIVFENMKKSLISEESAKKEKSYFG